MPQFISELGNSYNRSCFKCPLLFFFFTCAHLPKGMNVHVCAHVWRLTLLGVFLSCSLYLWRQDLSQNLELEDSTRQAGQ